MKTSEILNMELKLYNDYWLFDIKFRGLLVNEFSKKSRGTQLTALLIGENITLIGDVRGNFF